MTVRSNAIIAAIYVCGLVIAPATAAAGNPLAAFLDGLDTFSADFEQVLLDPSGEALEVSRGVLRWRRPGMFYWSYETPYRQQIISDGASLWVYEEDLEQVTISTVDEAIADTPALVFSGQGDLEEYYLIEDLEPHAGRARVELTPRRPESHYHALRLAFHGDQLAEMALLDRLGQTLLLTFTNASRNPALARAYFTFTPAQDMEVIDARQ